MKNWILVADDNDMARDIMTESLKVIIPPSIEIHSVTDGHKAKEVIHERGLPAAIVSDFDMGAESPSGIDILKEFGANVPVIIVSGTNWIREEVIEHFGFFFQKGETRPITIARIVRSMIMN